MKRSTKHMLTLPLAASLALAAAGCQWMAPQSRPGDVDAAAAAASDDRAPAESGDVSERLAQRERELVQRSIELENQREANRLLQAELDATLVDLHYLESQFVTLEHQLTREETKASAVATLADAQVLYDRSRESGSGGLGDDDWMEIDRRMTSAEEAMTRQHYAAAAYHAHRAMRLLNRSERQRNSFLSSGTARVVFVSLANVRKGPGQGSEIVDQLERGTVVVELERDEDWTKVRMRSGDIGWIHASLLR
jgi:hypothetical protein